MAIDQRVAKRAPAERCFKTWWRSVFIATSVMLLVLVPSVAHADTDDDVPGVPTSVGQTVTGVVDSTTDRYDVYSIALTEGEEVNIYITDSTPGLLSSSVYVELLPPGSLTIGSAHDVIRIGSDGVKSYVPASSGTYYLVVGTSYHGMSYTLRTERSATPAVQTPDSDDIPGIPQGNGTWQGVVDSRTDPHDLYAITLIAGQQATIGISDQDPGLLSSSVYVELLPPGSLSIASAHSLLRVGSDGIKSYMPAVSGTYYLEVGTSYHGMLYTVTLTGAGQPPSVPLFSDIASCPYRTAIEAMAQAGIISGYGNGLFGPDDPVKRAQFAKMAVLSLDLPVTEGGLPVPFWDVEKPTTNLYPDDYVAVAAANGLILGYSDGSFRPYVDISRAQLLTIVVRMAERFKPQALTTPPAGWKGTLPASDPTHGANIAKAECSGLLTGINLSAFSVWGQATRGEVAQILWNLREK